LEESKEIKGRPLIKNKKDMKETNNINAENMKISMRIFKNPDDKKKAVFSISLGPLKIKGFRILPSEHENEYGKNIWIAPPSYMSGIGKYHRVFHCENKELWKQIEKKVFEEYERKRKEFLEDIPVVED